MSFKNFEYTSCVHIFFPCSKNNSIDVKNSKHRIQICKICGIMQIDSKPEEYKNCCEFNQLLLYEEIVENFIQREESDFNLYYLKKRKNLIDYLRKLCNNFKFSEETFHQAMEYIDIILLDKSKNSSKHDLIAIGCLLLAAKFVQNDPNLPRINCFLNPQREFYEVTQIAQSELDCLNHLKHRLYTFSAYSVMKYFLNNGIVINGNSMDEINQLYSLSFQILNKVVLRPEILIFSNLQIALSCILLATTLINKKLTEDMELVLEIVYDCKFDHFRDAYSKICM